MLLFVFKEIASCEKEDIRKYERIAIILKSSQSGVKNAVVLCHLIFFIKVLIKKETITNTNVMK